MSEIQNFQDWLESVQEAGNCPLNINDLLDEWPNFPDDYLHGSIKPDKTVPCADIRRAAQYADFNPEYTESSVSEVTDEDYRQAYYGDSSYGSGTLQNATGDVIKFSNGSHIKVDEDPEFSLIGADITVENNFETEEDE